MSVYPPQTFHFGPTTSIALGEGLEGRKDDVKLSKYLVHYRVHPYSDNEQRAHDEDQSRALCPAHDADGCIDQQHHCIFFSSPRRESRAQRPARLKVLKYLLEPKAKVSIRQGMVDDCIHVY
jgi:hypothetical protein